jgi:hypothetical protein
VTNFAPETVRGVARHVRRMIRSVKSGTKNHLELAYALAAAKIVVATLETACQAAGIPDEVMCAAQEMAEDSRAVMDLVRWR